MSCRIDRVVVVAFCLITLTLATPRGRLGAQQSAQPLLLMSGVQRADGTRYSVTVADPGQLALDDLQMSVQLPDDALLDHALETPGFTQFAGNQDRTLTWNAVSYAPGDVIDAFSFVLQQPSSGTFVVSASWDGDDAGQVQGQFQPDVQTATDASGDITLDAATLAQGFVPVGNTGVIIAAVSGTIPAGTVLHVSVLGADNDPDASQGDLWWCAVVEVDGLPAGASLLLLVPARQALPPNAQVTLLTQDGDRWNPLADSAQVTSDGQEIMYQQPGGTVAAGTSSSNQPKLPMGAALTKSTSRPPVAPPAIILGLNELAMVNLMQGPANCDAQDCGGLLPCGPGTFNPNLPLSTPGTNAQAGTRSCVNAAQGHTTCKISGQGCGGNSPLNDSAQPFQPAGAGHGTACTFPSISTAEPFSCTTF